MEDTNRLLPEDTLLRNDTYRIERSLGSGGFGNTYLVRHIGLDAKMVVKEFFMKGINLREGGNTVTVSVPDNRATFESQRAKFKKEAQRLWKLKSEHIVSVHDIFEENGTAYYVMDFIDGESLEARLKREGTPLQESEVIDILNQLLDALATIHNDKSEPIFHLDIKPGNILLGRDGRVVLIDFGASKQLSGEREGVTSTMITYTRGYAPTEQVDSKLEHIGAWTDLYAVGATLYRLLTMNQPPEPSDIIIEGVDAFSFPDNVSAKMRELIVWLMQPNRKKRPQSVKQVREWLEHPVQPANRKSDSTPTGRKEKPETNVLSDDETVIQSQQKIDIGDRHPRNPKKPLVIKSPWKKGLIAICAVAVLTGLFFLIHNKIRAAQMAAQAEEKAFCELDSLILYSDYTATDTLTYYLNEFMVRYPNSSHIDDVSAHLQELQERKKNFTVNGVSFKMIRVDSGTFTMGATSEQGSEAYSFEKPAHRVTLSTYYIGETEVTQALWEAVMGSNPSNFKGTNLPVESVSWDDCKTFISKLNSITGKNFRLPTEAEWEFAARGGNKSRGYKYSGSNTLDNVAWYDGNSDSGTHSVKTKSPNELGLYDMSGNVWEWCGDCRDYYSSSSQTNPTGSSSGSERVLRGGCWQYSASSCRVSNRGSNVPGIRSNAVGLRLALWFIPNSLYS